MRAKLTHPSPPATNHAHPSARSVTIANDQAVFENVIIGTDKSVMAAKQLGADKRVSMWQADAPVGKVILQPPARPRIDHEVEILPPIPDITHQVPWIEPKYKQAAGGRAKPNSTQSGSIEPSTERHKDEDCGDDSR